MALPVITEARGVFKVTVATAISVGDLMAYNGSAWVRADADTFATLWARGIALNSADGVLQTEVSVARDAMVYDEDAPYTAGSKLYLSGTAGAHTHTRPSTAGQLRQVVGEAFTTTVAHVRFRGLSEVHLPIQLISATSAVAALDSGNFGGPTLDAQNEVSYLGCTLPENLVSVEKAVLVLAAEASAGTPTIAVAVSGAFTNTQHDAITPDTSLTGAAAEGTNPDDIYHADISTAINATSIVQPGISLGIKVTADDAGTDVRVMHPGFLVCNVAA